MRFPVTWVTWLLLAIAVAGCGDAGVARRYRGERMLFWADRDFAEFTVDASGSPVERWEELAERYESIGRQNLDVQPDSSRPATLEVRNLAARALFRSAQIHAALNDSLWVERVFTEMAETFDSAPNIAGEVWLARGRAAESRGELAEAIDWYRLVVRDFTPDPGAPGVAGSVLELPLRIVRARAQLGDRDRLEEDLVRAQQYYRELSAPGRSVRLRAMALLLLGQTLGEGGDWGAAAAVFDSLETWLGTSPGASIPPSQAALEGLVARHRAGSSLRALSSHLEALLEVHARTPAMVDACVRLAGWLAERGDLDRAMAWSDRAVTEATDPESRASALLVRGRLLSRQGRWVESFQDLRRIQAEHPVSEAALASHVELAMYFSRLGDGVARQEALDSAESELRSFVERYPKGAHTILAFEHLITVLEMKGDYEAAVYELLALGEHVRGTSREPAVLMRAAREFEVRLQDLERAAAILEDVATRFPQTRIGARAANEALRLRADG